MKVASAFSSLALLAASSLALLAASSLAIRVSYDTVFDNPAKSLDIVSCGGEKGGLISKGFHTFGSLPTFPFIGGAQVVTDYGSRMCASCWTLTFENRTIHMLAIDAAQTGFNLGEQAMNNLTNGRAALLGVVDATPALVAPSICNMTV